MTTKTHGSASHVVSRRRVAARALGLLAVASLLVACSTSVIRQAGNGPVAVSTPRYGGTVPVSRGDTLYRIAAANNVTMRDLAAWNGLSPPYTIYPGQRLRLYPSAGGNRSAVGPAPPRERTAGTAARPATKPQPATTPTPAPASSGIGWRWPAEGQIIGRYAAADPTKQGIDIAGTGGAPVRAAGDGVVVYSGSGLVGYGELIIIKHNEQWLSAYGHNRNRLVNEGQVVKAGQQIAELGRSGAPRDMLHFEIRYNGKPVDPLSHLPRK